MVAAASLCLVQVTQAQDRHTSSRTPGGSVRTDLGYGITVNKESSLEREWVTVHYPGLAADLIGTAGVRTIFQPERVRGEYRYQANFKIAVKEPLSAINVRFLLFDVWGHHIRTLGLTRVADMQPGEHELSGEWRLFSENEASEYYASVGYVARIRTKAGRVIAADVGPVLDEARKFHAKFSAEDLEAKGEKK
jgi:hypothetical protein